MSESSPASSTNECFTFRNAENDLSITHPKNNGNEIYKD